MADVDNYRISLDEVIEECKDCPELYNKVSNILYKKFSIHSAELSLVITSIVNELNMNK